jgi:hypothetical protein
MRKKNSFYLIIVYEGARVAPNGDLMKQNAIAVVSSGIYGHI